MKLKKLKSAAFTQMGSAWLLALTLPAVAHSHALSVQNFTNYSVHEYLTEHLKPEIAAWLKQEGLALFVTGAAHQQSRLCFTMIGVTEPAPADRNPRIPAVRFSSMSGSVQEAWNPHACLSGAFGNAVTAFNRESPDDLSDRLHRVRADGNHLPDETADHTAILINSNGATEKESELVRAQLNQTPFAQRFDYRQVQVYLYVSSVAMKSGVACVAEVGIAGRTSQERNSRYPGLRHTSMSLNGQHNAEQCRATAVHHATQAMVKNLETPEKLLTDFPVAREDGVAPPAKLGVTGR